MGSHADAAFANPDALAGKSLRRGESPSCYAHKSASCTFLWCALCICSSSRSGLQNSILGSRANLALALLNCHFSCNTVTYCTFPCTLLISPNCLPVLCLANFTFDNIHPNFTGKGVFKDLFCAHFDSTLFIPTFTVRRMCLQFWAFSELLRWDLGDVGEVPTVPSGSLATAQGCPHQGFL